MYPVILRRDYTPVFPDRCICCSGDPKGGTAAVCSDDAAWWNFSRSDALRTPACPACRWRPALKHWGKWGFVLGGAFLLYYFLFPHVAPIPNGLTRTILAVVFLPIVLFACFSIWYYAVPRTIELEADKKWLKLEFADDDYALDFALLNDPGVIATWRDAR